MNVDIREALKKVYPKTISVKRNIIVGFIIAGFIAVGIVLFNFYVNVHAKTKIKNVNAKESPKNVVLAESPQWYKNLQIRKPVATTNQSGPVSDKPSKSNIVPKKQQAQPQAEELSQNQATKDALESQAKEAEEMKKIMSAAISSNQISLGSTEIADNNVTSLASTLTNNPEPKWYDRRDQKIEESEKSDQNMQGEKKAFLKFNNNADDNYLRSASQDPMSPYEVKAGTIIPAILITGIDSDLPGQIIGKVRANVYDSIAGKYLLIPQGAKLIGLYDSQVAFGQERVLVVWKRIIYPNGQSINLEGMPGVDLSGYAGFSDQVNNHYGKIFSSVILASIISAGSELSQPRNDDYRNTNPTINQTLAASLGTNIMNAANMTFQKNLNLQPTLVIRPGFLMNISVTKDLVFLGPYEESTSYANYGT